MPTPGLSTMRTLFRDFTSAFSTATASTATVDLYLNRGMEELNRRTGFSFTDDATTLLVSGQQEYDLPAGFVAPVWAELSGRPLDLRDMDDWRREDADWRNAVGSPREWALYGRKVILAPKPTGDFDGLQLTLRFVSAPPDLTTYGAPGLGTQDYPVPVYWAASLWSGLYPDNALAVARRDYLKGLFDEAVPLIRAQLGVRSVNP